MNERDRIVAKVRQVVELNLREPLVRDDVRMSTPLMLAHRRGVKIDENTMMIIVLHHVRPALIWEITISWRSAKYFEPERISDLACFVLTGPEMATSDVDMPTDLEVPMATITANYVPVVSEDHIYEGMTRNLQDHQDFDLRAFLGMPDPDADVPHVLEATPDELIAFSGPTNKPQKRA